MSEPTIDEMLLWLEAVEIPIVCEDVRHKVVAVDVEFRSAIRAILEQHKLETTDEPESRLTVWGYTLKELGEIVRSYEENNDLQQKSK